MKVCYLFFGFQIGNYTSALGLYLNTSLTNNLPQSQCNSWCPLCQIVLSASSLSYTVTNSSAFQSMAARENNVSPYQKITFSLLDSSNLRQSIEKYPKYDILNEDGFDELLSSMNAPKFKLMTPMMVKSSLLAKASIDEIDNSQDTIQLDSRLTPETSTTGINYKQYRRGSVIHHLQQLLIEPFIVIPGDIFIATMIPISQSGSGPFRCGRLSKSKETQSQLQAFMYAIETARKR